MKKTILIVLISLSGILTAQTPTPKITYGGYDDIKGYLSDPYTKNYEIGLLTSASVGYAMNYFTEKPALSAFTGMVVADLAGVGRQVYNKEFHKGDCNVMSVTSTVMGAAVSALANRVIFHLQHKSHHYAKWLFNEVDKISKDDIKDIMAVK
jgi:hypothetical protein